MAEIERPFTEIRLTVPWGHIAARTYGSSAGERVLLVHGRQDNAGSFARLMKYLPMDSFYYVCIDLPGHGWSSHFPSWQMLDLLDYAHILHFILEALQWETCIFIGHSMGAQMGLVFSIFQPQKIKKIISFDAFLTKIKYSPKDNFVTYFKNASALSIKNSNNVKPPPSYTKEEILYAFEILRYAPLNSEAANALFERAVTEIDGKYIYNRDIRLRNNPFAFLSTEQAIAFNRKLSVPIYLFIASRGIVSQNKEKFQLASEVINSKIPFEITYVDGNHDFHNNNPERIAPFLCKILNSSISSKL